MTRKLLAEIGRLHAQATAAIGKLPFWPDVVKMCRLICTPLYWVANTALRMFPVLHQAEWLLETERLTQRSPVVLAFSMLFVFWRGLHPTSLGHIGTDRLIYPFLAALSGFNPFLGLVCGAVYGAGDIIQKLVWSDIYGAKTGIDRFSDLNYWGAIVGCIVAYSSLICMGLLPGLLSRLVRAGVRNVLRAFKFGRAAATSDGASGGVPSASSQPLGAPEFPAAELLASVVTGAIVGHQMLDTVAPVTEGPQFDWRPDPDESCKALEQRILRGQAPGGGISGLIGGVAPFVPPGTPPPKKPREYEGRDNPWDPSEEKQREMWETRGVVWDPNELKWRPPKPGEIPKPVDYPEKPPPFEKQMSRDDVPWQCVGLYDEYVTAQSQFGSLVSDVQAAQAKYDASHMHLLKQLMKAYLKLSWDTASLTGGGVSGVHGAGSGARSGFKPSGGGPGIASAALRKARGKVVELGAKIARLTDEVAELAKRAAEKARIAKGLKTIAEEAASRAAQIRQVLEPMQARANKLLDLDRRLAAAAEKVQTAKTAVQSAKEKVNRLREMVSKLEGAEKAWEEWKKADDAVALAGKQDFAADMNLRRAEAAMSAEYTDLSRQRGMLMEQMDDAPFGPPKEAIRQQIRDLDKRLDSVGELVKLRNEYNQAVTKGMDHAQPIAQKMQQLTPRTKAGQAYSIAIRNAQDVHQKLQTAKAVKDQAEASLQKFENQGLSPHHAAQRRRELAAAETDLGKSSRALEKAQNAEAPIRQEHGSLKRQVDAEAGDLDANKRQLKTYDDNAEKANTRLREAETEAGDADHQRFLKESELNDSKQMKKSAESDVADLEAKEGHPPPDDGPGGGAATGGGPGSLSEQLKPGIVSGFEKVMQKLGELESKAFGTQWPDEMGAILKQCRTAMDRDLADFQAKQAELDACREAMRTLKPALDKCINEHASID